MECERLCLTPLCGVDGVVVGVDVDGTAVEKTKISFRGGDGGATVDYVVLTHAANKFKDGTTGNPTRCPMTGGKRAHHATICGEPCFRIHAKSL